MKQRFPPEPHQARLMRAYRVWLHSFEACSFVRTSGADIRRTDALPTFVELLARAALTDAIAESCDGMPLGLFRHTMRNLEGLLNPRTAGRVRAALARQIEAVEIARRSPKTNVVSLKPLMFCRP
jgi:hypothetical protein